MDGVTSSRKKGKRGETQQAGGRNETNKLAAENSGTHIHEEPKKGGKGGGSS